jgi:hypothetical protein
LLTGVDVFLGIVKLLFGIFKFLPAVVQLNGGLV